jgi:hypothetical protein
MVGTEEKRTTYPHFLLTREGELLYHYRDGGSGNGNEIYNTYNCETNSWKRLLDTPLTDGQGLMNAYQTQPTLMKDGNYHMYWVWRDTPDCSTNHDLSYMKSPDLKNWFDAFGKPIQLPATLGQQSLIVDPIPVEGGIINLAEKTTLFFCITNLIKMEIHSYFRLKFRIKVGFTIKSRIGTTDGFFQEMEVSIVKF